MTNKIQKPQVGELLHLTKSGLIFQKASGTRLVSEVSRRGEEYTLTKADLENIDRNGGCFWDLLHDPDRQVARWGEVVIAPGAAPEHLDPRSRNWRPENSAEADEERVKRREIALAIADPIERQKALSEIKRVLGPEQTSQTINSFASL